jgi:hypothetical protein
MIFSAGGKEVLIKAIASAVLFTLWHALSFSEVYANIQILLLESFGGVVRMVHVKLLGFRGRR